MQYDQGVTPFCVTMDKSKPPTLTPPKPRKIKILCGASYCPNNPPRGARRPGRKCLAYRCPYVVRRDL